MASVSQWRRQLQSGGLFDEAVREVLNGEHIEERCRQVQHIWRESFWSPTVTLLTFLLQVLSQEKTLRWAVASVLAQLAGRKVKQEPSADASA